MPEIFNISLTKIIRKIEQKFFYVDNQFENPGKENNILIVAKNCTVVPGKMFY